MRGTCTSRWSSSVRRAACAAITSACASACGGQDVTALFGAVTGIDALRPDAGTSTGGRAGAIAEPAGDPPAPADAGLDAGGSQGACGVARAAQYEFPGPLASGEGRVAYGEAVLDHVLRAELGAFIESLTARVQAGERFAAGALVARLAARLGAAPGNLAREPITLRLVGAPPLLERRLGELSMATNQLARLAGTDPGVEHRAWATAGAFRGFVATNLGRTPRTEFSPRSLLEACFEQLEQNAQNRAIGLLQTDPARAALPVHVMRDGRDLKTFVQSFLLGAVAFARAVDVELDDDVAGRGLAASEERLDGAGSSAIEHAWDMAFGHFGAARDFGRYVLADAGDGARDNGWFDTNADCRLSLLAEVSFGAASLALPSAAIAFASEAFDAAVAGRRLLAEAPGALSSAERERLLAARDRMIAAWERSLAATALRDLNQLESEIERALAASADYSFAEQARAWSGLTGLSLAFQFNRRSPLSAPNFDALHAAIGDAPSVPDTLPPRNRAALDAYRGRLGSARKLLVDAYGFDASAAARW